MNTLKEIPGFPGYFASPDGSIWTIKRKGGNERGPGRLLDKPRKLKAHFHGAGYMRIALDVNGRVVSRAVHTLILETFVGPRPQGFHACHYPDSTKTNNHLENLRWDSPSENAKDKYRGTIGREEKRCATCGCIRSLSDFYSDKRSLDGKKSECKRCHSATALRTRDPEKKRKTNAAFMRKKRDTATTYGR